LFRHKQQIDQIETNANTLIPEEGKKKKKSQRKKKKKKKAEENNQISGWNQEK